MACGKIVVMRNERSQASIAGHGDTAPAILRAASFGATYLLVSLALLVLFPPDNWDGGRWPRLDLFIVAWTAPPVWQDGDTWFINWVGHPIMGALLYSFARHAGNSVLRSCAFAVVASCVWEYGLESWFEPPSWIDLILTPTVGPLLGEARWRLRSRLLTTPPASRAGRWALAALAPVHVMWRRIARTAR